MRAPKTSRALCALSVVVAGCGGAQQAEPESSSAAFEECEYERARLAEENEALRADAQLLRDLERRRAELFAQLRESLATLLADGRVTLTFRRGLMVIQLPNQVLFQRGRATVSPEGAETLRVVGAAIAPIEDRRFLVAGHTDNQPIRASTWRTNWHLSSARAQAVLEVLVDAGVSADRLGAAGFGEHDPISSNDADESRASNRRTELVVMPDLERILRAVSAGDE